MKSVCQCFHWTGRSASRTSGENCLRRRGWNAGHPETDPLPNAAMAQAFWPQLPVVLESEHFGGSSNRGYWGDGSKYLQVAVAGSILAGRGGGEFTACLCASLAERGGSAVSAGRLPGGDAQRRQERHRGGLRG